MTLLESAAILFFYLGTHFEWHGFKAEANIRKHGVSFEEAATAFFDDASLVVEDPVHSQDELRFVLVGIAATGRILAVTHTMRAERFRIISARRATRKETLDHDGKGRT